MSIEKEIEGKDYIVQCKSCKKVRDPESKIYTLIKKPVEYIQFYDMDKIRSSWCNPCLDDYVSDHYIADGRGTE